MHDVHRLFHQPLRARDGFLQAFGVDRGLLRQGRQMDIDARQRLGDFIVQLAADLLPLFLQRGENLAGQVPQLVLLVARLLQ